MSNSQQFIGRLSKLGRDVLPSNAALWLYGSRAEDRQKSTDFEKYAYPFTLMAAEDNQMIIPQIYTKKQWKQMAFTPFVKNVEHDKIVLV